jgi:hypothetical protein
MIVHPMHAIDERGRRTGQLRPRVARLSHGDLRDEMRRTARHVAPPTSAVTIRDDVFASLIPMPTKQFRSAADAYLTFGASMMAPVHALDEPLAEYRVLAAGHFLRRMSGEAGLRTQVRLQETIVEHFDLGSKLASNSLFARNVFALAKFEAGVGDQLRTYAQLIRAVARDPSFTTASKAQLIAFWTACAAAPRGSFGKLWSWFLRKQAGLAAI